MYVYYGILFNWHSLNKQCTAVAGHGSLEALKKKSPCALLNLIVQSDKESGRMPTVYVVTKN